ncbi:MAG TPA: hypothetical protein VFX39_02005 [Gemmatimonadaceae bacterium]|nr:hypothetical protein [Gemmatimonadaceae bacterium]
MDPSFRSAQRCMEEWAPQLPPLEGGGATLEAMGGMGAMEPPRLVSASVIEGHALRARRIEGDPETGFTAFLDGTQQSRTVGYHDGLPIVFGTVAAVVRVRVNRRLYTWHAAPVVKRRIYLPAAYLPPALPALYAGRGFDVVDVTAPDADGGIPSRHPFSLVERAVHMVQEHRERAELGLAEKWCALEGTPLFIDGGVSKSELVARATCAVGVVKSHRTLYVEGEALERVFRLRRGERSSVFRVTPVNRTPVASWYLRLRDPAGHDPLWGLVRVEAADPDHTGEPLEALTRRADRISRWIMAESAPLALPDGRWDRMVYGIRDCEEFLRAVC